MSCVLYVESPEELECNVIEKCCLYIRFKVDHSEEKNVCTISLEKTLHKFKIKGTKMLHILLMKTLVSNSVP